MLCMNFVFASARFPSDFGFVSKKARSEVGSVGEISAWSARWGGGGGHSVQGDHDARSI